MRLKLILTSLVSVTAVALLVAYSVLTLRIANTKDTHNQLTGYTYTKISSSFFEKHRSEITKLASLETVGKHLKLGENPHDIHIITKSFQDLSGALFTGIIQNSGALEVFAADQSNRYIKTSMSEHDLFIKGMKGNGLVSPNYDSVLDKRYITFSSPVFYNGEPDPVGVAFAKFSTESIGNVLEGYPYPAALMTPEGVVFVSNVEEWLFKTAFESNESTQKPQRLEGVKLGSIPQKLDSDIISLSGIKYRTIISEIGSDPDNRWYLFTAYPAGPHDGLTSLQTNLISVTGLFVLVMLFIILLYTKSQHALVKSEEQYRKIFENAQEGIFQINTSGEIISINPSLARIFGYYSTQEIIDNNVRVTDELYNDPKDRQKLLDLLRTHGKIKDYEVRVRRNDNKDIWVMIQARSVRNSQNEIIYYEGLVEDVTQRKESDLKLRKAYDELERKVIERTAELEEINSELVRAKETADSATAAKSRFLANMSHEIRTPINSIIGASDMAMNEELPSHTEYLVKIIHSSAYSLMGIINDILDFSKIEAGKMEVDNKPMKLNSIIRKSVTLFTSRSEEKKIEIFTDCDPDIPVTVIGDPVRFQQIISNLLSNATKFTGYGGFIMVSTKLVNKSANAVQVRINVEDNGIGIPKEKVDALFEPFIQSDFSTTRKYGGTGLGLTITKELVELMGGTISLDSEKGRGSCFSIIIRFPIQNEEPEEQPEILNPRQVVLFDENREFTLRISRLLQHLGIPCERAESDAELIELSIPGGCIIICSPESLEKSLDISQINDIRENNSFIFMLSSGDKNLPLTPSATISKPIFRDMLMEKLALVNSKGDEQSQLEAEDSEFDIDFDLNGYKILIAEDNIVNQNIALAILQKEGAEVFTAMNGVEACRLAERGGFHIILMDVQMPEMDGLEATARLRQSFTKEQLPIIAMTAHASEEDREACYAAGMNFYLSKPVSRVKLLEAVKMFG
ncbi:PAS domain-containing hybrid sensor histidine kinase/response regulator [Limisalsivibrio acetivorans]|uniref:PAS domain-containing hybrid sensor histidine kinase/response regulator n=1 Tax=Limisalsivibrio acetivorans TaxID=1304888 RepID=UPI0003B5E633|nr:ATP-binding protein [Limisalsivibrio acetivorans]